MLTHQSLLTSDNFSKGFLLDEELMAGVSQNPDQPDSYIAFVLNHQTGEYLGYQLYLSLNEAISAINVIPRKWTFEKTKDCGDGNCDKGNCSTGPSSSGKCKSSCC